MGDFFEVRVLLGPAVLHVVWGRRWRGLCAWVSCLVLRQGSVTVTDGGYSHPVNRVVMTRCHWDSITLLPADDAVVLKFALQLRSGNFGQMGRQEERVTRHLFSITSRPCVKSLRPQRLCMGDFVRMGIHE
jgi:hypothetical protein